MVQIYHKSVSLEENRKQIELLDQHFGALGSKKNVLFFYSGFELLSLRNT
jgi:hypothetical protein